MPSTRSLFNAVVLGVLCGALGALWITVAEAQGRDIPLLRRAAPRPTAAPVAGAGEAVVAADMPSPRPTAAPKPVVDESPPQCP